VLAGEQAEIDNPDARPDLQTPFVLNSRDAWLPVERSFGQSAKLDVLMTSDAGRRWLLRGRFSGADLGGIFSLSPSTGFIETDVNGGLGVHAGRTARFRWHRGYLARLRLGGDGPGPIEPGRLSSDVECGRTGTRLGQLALCKPDHSVGARVRHPQVT
jgi:hypothetical protein